MGAVLVHLGSSNFLERFKIYVAHVQEWRTQFQKLQSVDLRYEHQVIVNPDAVPTRQQPKASAAARSKARTLRPKNIGFTTEEEAQVNHGKSNREPAYGDRRR